MRQLDLFGFDSEPQQAAPPQKKTVTVLRATPPPPVSDNTTLVFADNQIGIKIKLKREVPFTDDTTQMTAVPTTGDTEPPVLQQLTLEEAILEVIKETAPEQEPAQLKPAKAAHQPLTRPAIISIEIEEEQPEAIAPPEPDPVAKTIEDPAEAATTNTEPQEPPATPVAAQQWLVKPAVISIEEEKEEAISETTGELISETTGEEINEAQFDTDSTEPTSEAQLPTEITTDVPEETTAPAAVAKTSTWQFLARPAIIEIEEEEQEESHTPEQEKEQDPETIQELETAHEPETVQEPEVIEEPEITEEPEAIHEPEATEEPETIQEPEVITEEEKIPEAVIEEETVPQAQEEQLLMFNEQNQQAPITTEAPATPPPPPAKIKAPKPSAKEPAGPKKRGRKSFKEIDAETDLIQLPDDDLLFEKQYYPISVVAGWFNVNASLLRFWENEFDILKPRKNRKGDRLFRPEDVKNLQVIYYLLRQRKFTIEGAKEYLKTNKKKADTNTQLIQSLTKLRGFLLEFKANLDA